MDKIVFCRKIKIAVVEPDKEKRSEQYSKLREIQYNVWKLANKIIQGQYVAKFLPEIVVFKHQQNHSEFKQIELQLAEISKIKKLTPANKELKRQLYEKRKEFIQTYQSEIDEFFRNQSIQNFTYSLNGVEFKDLIPSNIRASLNQKIYKDFNNAYKRFAKGEIKLQSYKRTIPVPFQAKAINNLTATVNENGKKEYTFTMFGIDFVCLLGRDGNNTAHILDDLIAKTGQFELKDSSFSIKGTELFLNASIATEQVKTKKNENIVAGIDLGVSRMATMVIKDITSKNSTYYIERKYYGDKSFMDRAMAHQHRLKEVSRNVMGKTGKGRLHAQKKKLENKAKFQNFRDTFNKKIAHSIVQRCLANSVSKIYMEELSSNIGEENFFMKNWPYFDLQQKIINKASEYGIEVLKVPAAYTSQRCAKCGNIDSNNRVDQKEMNCTQCDYKGNADVNAAINIIDVGVKQLNLKTLKENKKNLVEVI